MSHAETVKFAGIPEVTAAAERADKATAAFRAIHHRRRDLERRLNTARRDDAEAAAAAIEAGRKIPEPSEIKIRVELDGLAREHEAHEIAHNRALLDYQAIVGQNIEAIANVADEQRQAAVELAAALLEQLSGPFQALAEAGARLDWCDHIRRWRDDRDHHPRFIAEPAVPAPIRVPVGGGSTAIDHVLLLIASALADQRTTAGV